MNYNYKELVEMVTNIDVDNIIAKEKETWLSVHEKEAGSMWNILKAEIASRSLFGIAYIEAAEAAQGVPEINKVLGVLAHLTGAYEYYERKKIGTC